MNEVSSAGDHSVAMGSAPSLEANGQGAVQRSDNSQSSADNLLVTAVGGAAGRRPRHQQQGSGHRKHRSLSSPRTASASPANSRNKPKKSQLYLGSASASLTSIPNAIKLTMLNSGLLSVGIER